MVFFIHRHRGVSWSYLLHVAQADSGRRTRACQTRDFDMWQDKASMFGIGFAAPARVQLKVATFPGRIAGCRMGFLTGTNCDA